MSKMKITQVDIYIYKLDQHYRLRGVDETPGLLPGTDYFVEPFWRQTYSQKVESCLVKITTSDGISGWGEAQSPLLPETAGTIIQKLVGPFLLGKNPLRREWIYDQLYHLNNVRGHGSGFMMDAIAAVDIALWDIAGKHFQSPVCELMGGPFTHTLKAYISGLRQPNLDEQCLAAKEFVNQGYAGIKLFLGHGFQEDCHAIRIVREAVGESTTLLCDLLWRYRLDEALRIGRILDSEGYEWLEAPLPPEDLAGHRKLVQALDVPIAIGEAMRSIYEFQPWLESESLEITQPDVVRMGLTAARKLAALAEARRIPVAPHVGVCTAIGMAATWQFAASIPNFLIQEYQFELLQTANGILKSPLTTDSGELKVPTDPGLGIEVDEEKLSSITADLWSISI